MIIKDVLCKFVARCDFYEDFTIFLFMDESYLGLLEFSRLIWKIRAHEVQLFKEPSFLNI